MCCTKMWHELLLSSVYFSVVKKQFYLPPVGGDRYTMKHSDTCLILKSVPLQNPVECGLSL